MRDLIYSSNLLDRIKPQKKRDAWVIAKILSLQTGSSILDAGCGSQRYRKFCNHLIYKAQDFGEYSTDEMKSVDSPIGGSSGYEYGPLDYTGNIWSIQEKDEAFDSILCTEVLEHVPYPVDAILELIRLLKPGGVLFLTAPTYSIKHMDPFHYFTGFTNRFYEKISEIAEVELVSLEPNLNYYEVLSMEIARILSRSNILLWPLLLPAFLILYFKKPPADAIHALPYGYHVVFRKYDA